MPSHLDGGASHLHSGMLIPQDHRSPDLDASPIPIWGANSPQMQDSPFLQSLTASMMRPSEQMGQLTPERRKQHASRIPLHPRHSPQDDTSSGGMGLERLASLRMDSGDLNDSRYPQYGRSNHRPSGNPYVQRYPLWEMGGRDGMHPGMGMRHPMYDDEVNGPGGYGHPYAHQDMRGPDMRGASLSMAMSDPYLARHAANMPGPRSAPRSRGHMHYHSATDIASFEAQMANSSMREGHAWQPLTPNNSLHRSQSEGYALGPPTGGPPPGKPLGPSNDGYGHPESSTNSGKSAQKEPSSGGRSGSLHESPDFAMIYAFLGSMFDPVCHMINHADVMQQMAPVDRETTVLILENCVHNLDTPYFLESYLQQIRMTGPLGASQHQPPPMLSRDSSKYDAITRHSGRGGP